MAAAEPTVHHIMNIAMGFQPAQALMTGVEFGLFTLLDAGPLPGATIAEKLGLKAVKFADWLDILVTKDILLRDADGKYSNPPDVAKYLVEGKPDYAGGLLNRAKTGTYVRWGRLGESLKSGTSLADKETDFAGKVYKTDETAKNFLGAMAAIQRACYYPIVSKFDFSKFPLIMDVGGAIGQFSVDIARKFPNQKYVSLDLPVVCKYAREYIAGSGIPEGTVTVAEGDFLKDAALPKADAILMSQILHDWNLPEIMMLIKKVYDALPAGGIFMALEQIIDDDRRENTYGMAMTFNVLMTFGMGGDYTHKEFDGWCREVGFARTEKIHLGGSSSAVVAWK